MGCINQAFSKGKRNKSGNFLQYDRPIQVKMFGAGKKIYSLFTKDTKTGKEWLDPSLSNEIKNSLGESAEEILVENRDTIQEQRQRLVETEKQQRQAEALTAEREKQAQEMKRL